MVSVVLPSPLKVLFPTTPASALTLILSRLSCVLALGFSVSTSASLCPCLCLCPYLSLFSSLCCYWLQLTLRSSKTSLGLHRWDSWTAAPPCPTGTGTSPVQPHPSPSPAWRTAAVGPVGVGQGDVSSHPSSPIGLG